MVHYEIVIRKAYQFGFLEAGKGGGFFFIPEEFKILYMNLLEDAERKQREKKIEKMKIEK